MHNKHAKFEAARLVRETLNDVVFKTKHQD